MSREQKTKLAKEFFKEKEIVRLKMAGYRFTVTMVINHWVDNMETTKIGIYYDDIQSKFGTVGRDDNDNINSRVQYYRDKVWKLLPEIFGDVRPTPWEFIQGIVEHLNDKFSV